MLLAALALVVLALLFLGACCVNAHARARSLAHRAAGGVLVSQLARASQVLAPVPAVGVGLRAHAAPAQKAVVSNRAPEPAAERALPEDDAGGARGRRGGLARLRAGARRRRSAAGTAAAADAVEKVVTSSEDEGNGGGAGRDAAEAVQGERGARPAVSGKVAREERRQEKEQQKEALREQQLQKVRS